VVVHGTSAGGNAKYGVVVHGTNAGGNA